MGVGVGLARDGVLSAVDVFVGVAASDGDGEPAGGAGLAGGVGSAPGCVSFVPTDGVELAGGTGVTSTAGVEFDGVAFGTSGTA